MVNANAAVEVKEAPNCEEIGFSVCSVTEYCSELLAIVELVGLSLCGVSMDEGESDVLKVEVCLGISRSSAHSCITMLRVS